MGPLFKTGWERKPKDKKVKGKEKEGGEKVQQHHI